MKKLIVILCAVCVVFAGVIGYVSTKNGDEKDTTETPAATDAATAVEEAPSIAVPTLDYEALYATHKPDDIVMTMAGHDMKWSEYFYWLHYYGQQVESYFNTMASYGTQLAWTDVLDGDTKTYAAYVTDGAEASGKQIAALEGFAGENDVTLSPEDETALAEQEKSDISSSVGEDGDEEEFFSMLADTYLTKELYERMNRVNYLYQNGFTKLYGEDGALVDDESAMKYLIDNGYMSANHILLLTSDPETGEALDDTAKAEKKAQAQKIAEELQGITDQKALLERFSQLKEEYCQDTGKTLYPDGYVFTSGTMVQEFEAACEALDEYGVSDAVETSYGYHVLMRLPLDVDAVIEYSNAGTALNARNMMANEEYGARIQGYLDDTTVTFAPGFEVPDLTKYIK